jgi:hypothetical protein
LEYFQDHPEQNPLVDLFLATEHTYLLHHEHFAALLGNRQQELSSSALSILAIADPRRVLNQNEMRREERSIDLVLHSSDIQFAVNLSFVVKEKNRPDQRKWFIG